MADEECDRLRALLRLSSEPGVPDGRQDAGVLILLDGTPDEYRVFLCIRSEELRRHPGEVCFPGGMRDGGENMQETAMREAEEEVGLLRDDFILLGSLPSFRARFGVLIHPTVALLRRPFFPRLNVHEVQDTFWMPLERFLDDSVHMSFVVDNKYAVHSFSFEEAHTFGVTALMCIVTAIGVLQKMPSFDIAPMLPASRLAKMSPSELISQVCEYAGQPLATLAKL
ncbi:hypothetical protein Y032_0459g1833 [Ancylostoma ceylanicum]|uniref:Nudix hydrolase domain-containing protein n=1 Tax=Ancylostoma ceylanicum TaxID=53326 RepID=A0A016WY35_9BILA|nr:hypothetical protein Y032_0459g1833 [Ancylostoma ceylanicum]